MQYKDRNKSSINQSYLPVTATD